MSAIFWSSYVGFPIFPLLWTIYYFVSLPNLVFFFHGLLTFYITFWFAFPSLQISILLGFFHSFSFCAVQLSHLYSQHIRFVIYFHGCFVDMISCFYFKKHPCMVYPYASTPPSTDGFPLPLSLPLSRLHSFVIL